MPTKKGQRPAPEPRGFVENAWYENIARIMRTDPRRFFLFSPATKYALSVYLNLKERHTGTPEPAPVAERRVA